MGHFICISEFYKKPNDHTARSERDTDWFFPTQKIDVERMYPHRLSIQQDVLTGRGYRHDEETSGLNRVAIRKFVERSLEGDVVWRVENMTYYCVYPAKNERDRAISSSVEHGYYHFDFETEADMFHFALQFGTLVSKVQDTHPEWEDDPKIKNFFGRGAAWDARAFAQEYD